MLFFSNGSIRAKLKYCLTRPNGISWYVLGPNPLTVPVDLPPVVLYSGHSAAFTCHLVSRGFLGLREDRGCTPREYVNRQLEPNQP